MRYLRIVLPIIAVVGGVAVYLLLRQPVTTVPAKDFELPDGPPPVMDTAYPESDRQLTVILGEPFTIELEGNLTTGFSWMETHDDTMFDLRENVYTAHKAGETGTAAIGSGGIQRFTYEALKPGTGTLTFIYARPWESVQPRQTVIYTVTVE